MTSEVVTQRTAKVPRDSDDDDDQDERNRRDHDDKKASKAKRHDIEVPMAEVDIKLAEKLDNILKISDTRKPRFFMNKPKAASLANKECDNVSTKTTKSDINDKIPLKHRDFTREQLRQRLSEKYDTLVPELDPKRPTVKLVKILSATESLELAKEQSRKQLEHQLELSSVSGNRQAKKDGISKFRFKDGYELPPKCFEPKKHKSVSFASNGGHANEVMTTVKYFKPDENEATSSEHDSDDNTEDDDDDDTDDDDDDISDDDDDDDVEDDADEEEEANADNATDKSCHLLTETDAQHQNSGQQRSGSVGSKPMLNSGKLEQPKQKIQVQNNNQQQQAAVAANNTIDDESGSELENYWLNQRDLFFNMTSFELAKETNELVGPEYGNQTYHLPFWFDYDMFNNVTDRSFNDSKIVLKRHHIYIDNCVSIWKSNALKRLHRPNNYTFIDHAEDWTQQENYNEEWNEISLNLTSLELREQPVAKGLRLVQEELIDCTRRRDKNLCILLLIDLDERFGPSMKLRYPFEEERYRSLLDIDAAEEAAAEFSDSLLSSDGKSSYWLDRREQFFRNTTFTLSASKLVENFNNNKRRYHLPYWFDYEVFKRMVGRINETPQEELKSHHKYIDSCLEIWNDTAADRLGQLDYEAVPITSHVDIPARTCLYHCNPFDYDLTEDEIRESPVDKAIRLVQEELDQARDRKRAILLLVELEERFDFPRAKGMRYPYEQPERSREDFWKYVEERDNKIADFVKTL